MEHRSSGRSRGYPTAAVRASAASGFFKARGKQFVLSRHSRHSGRSRRGSHLVGQEVGEGDDVAGGAAGQQRLPLGPLVQRVKPGRQRLAAVLVAACEQWGASARWAGFNSGLDLQAGCPTP